jgi:hypothetical protein
LEVGDKIVREWKPGEPEVVTIAEQLPTGVDLVARLTVQLVNELPPDLAVPIDIEFIVDDQFVAGYRHLLVAAQTEEVADRAMDALFGALRDIEVAFAMEEATQLARSVQRSVVRYRESPSKVLDSLRRQVRQLANIAQRLDVAEAPEAPAVQRRLYELVGLLMTWSESQNPTPLLLRIHELADRVQEHVGRVVRRSL